MTVETLYRAEINVYQSGYGMRPYARVTMSGYRVVKETPCGVWIDVYGSRRFVNLKLFRKWAWPTKEEAMVSLLARKRRQRLLLREQLARVEFAVRHLEADGNPPAEPASDPLSLDDFA